MKKIVKNEKGIGLMEAMIAGGVMLIMALAFLQLTSNQQKQIRFLDSKQEVIDTKNSLFRVLAPTNTSACCLMATNTIGDLTLDTSQLSTPLSVQKIYQTCSGTQELMSVANGVQGQQRIKIKDITLNNFSQLSANHYMATLQVGVQQVEANSTAMRPIQVAIVNIQTTGSTTFQPINQCWISSLEEGSSDSFWKAGTTSGSIYYSGGPVGIGTSTPTAALDVAGSVKPGDESQATLCDANREGAQRYNKTTHRTEFCGYNAGPPVSYGWETLSDAPLKNYAIHSQTGVVPTCPTGYQFVRSGYSLVTIVGSGGGGVVELASEGSCPPIFRSQMAAQCRGTTCDAVSAEDLTGWLSTFDGGNIVARCAVCSTSKAPLVVHSYSTTIPNCPTGYVSQRVGYSFLGIRITTGPSLPTDLSSTGSCLSQFRLQAFVQCDWESGYPNNDRCDANTSEDYTYWVNASNINVNTSSSSNTSRCRVCDPQ